MKKITEKNLISGRIDYMGRLLLPSSQMKSLNFVEGEKVSLDFNDEGIIIAKSLGYSIAYDRVRVMPNGILIGRDICRSKLLMTDDRRIVENIIIKTYNDNDDYLRDDLSEVVYYNIDYRIDNDRIVIPLTKKQQQSNLRVVRTVDELGRIVIPPYLRKIYNLAMETGIEIKQNNIIISNGCERKVKINEHGMITLPEDILKNLEIEPRTELEIEASKKIILSTFKKQ
jgi:bifunctional DNA-binding transcriptional regulator/antitoxin component of YhaV-PrlF toxin-antitoxin module